jgi:hypothetical protein
MQRTVRYRGFETSSCAPLPKTCSSRGCALMGRPGIRKRLPLAHGSRFAMGRIQVVGLTSSRR